MIRSMTGLGLATADSGGFRGSVLIRSVNHRFLELTVRTSRTLGPLEAEIKDLVQSRVQRGRVEVSVRGQFEDASVSVNVSRGLARALVEALRDVAQENGLHDELSVGDLVQVPGLVEVADEPVVQTARGRSDLMGVVAQALDRLEEMRRAEGTRLSPVLADHLGKIAATLDGIVGSLEAARGERREALRTRAREVREDLGLEDARLYQEIARLVDRSDVDEEVQRLRSHVAQAHDGLEADGPVGKTLDFLAQEMAREANTIASKAVAGGVGRRLIDLRSEIERFREQVQNVE